jgi:hypothetical protein
MAEVIASALWKLGGLIAAVGVYLFDMRTLAIREHRETRCMAGAARVLGENDPDEAPYWEMRRREILDGVAMDLGMRRHGFVALVVGSVMVAGGFIVS